MKLPFQHWIIEKRFGKSINVLFDESFTSFKNAAYRSSLLFSYLGFLTILKELIIRTTKPAHIDQGRWDALIRKLQNDEAWEKAVFEEVINSSSPIFNINDDIRQQVKYWKDRRNDCAHFKTNDIESHHTEAFWSFIKSNLSKVTIEGGRASLLNKFEKHYDPTFTPPNADVTPLVLEIDSSVEPTELNTFWDELVNQIDPYTFSFSIENDVTRVIRSVFINCREFTRESLANYLKSRKVDLTIISMYTELINYFSYSPPEAREIWRTRISDKRLAFEIYGALLRGNLIPSAELSEAHSFAILHFTHKAPEEDATHLALSANGFGDVLFQTAIIDKRLDPFLWVNARADMVAYYLAKYPLKKETVEVICEMTTRSKYSWWLIERVVKIFTENAEKKRDFHAIATSNSYSIPDDLQ